MGKSIFNFSNAIIHWGRNWIYSSGWQNVGRNIQTVQFARGSSVVACVLQGKEEADLMLESQFMLFFLKIVGYSGNNTERKPFIWEQINHHVESISSYIAFLKSFRGQLRTGFSDVLTQIKIKSLYFLLTVLFAEAEYLSRCKDGCVWKTQQVWSPQTPYSCPHILVNIPRGWSEAMGWWQNSTG